MVAHAPSLAPRAVRLPQGRTSAGPEWRRGQAGDRPAFGAFLRETPRDDLYLRYLGRPPLDAPKRMEAFIEGQLFPRDPGAAWVMYMQGSARMVGHAVLRPEGENKAELGILIASEARRTGSAMRLIENAKAYALEKGITEVHALIDRHNGPVKGLLMNSGFTRQGAWVPDEDPLYVWLAPKAG
jgi:RimJ/RimL family protein N-acetyltransferase